nr:MAG TPA: hypothetical protein [Caudoviricetes sp.]
MNEDLKLYCDGTGICLPLSSAIRHGNFFFLFLFFVATILTFLTSLRIKKYTTVLKNTIVYYTKYVMITSLTCLSRS